MSTIIKFDIGELRKLAHDKQSCVVEKKVTENLALQPWCLGNLKDSVKNLLDYKIGKFDKEFSGILLSYKNLRILQNVGCIRNDNADINFQVQADYFIFQPYVGAVLKGIVNKKSQTHLGILVHRVFNVVIPRPTEEPGNKWIGHTIEEGQQVVFRIVVLDLFGALPYIRGELDERCLKLGPDGDDEIRDSKLDNISYVNFDKIKPHVQKHSEVQTNLSSINKTSSKSKSVINKEKAIKKNIHSGQMNFEDNNYTTSERNNKEKSDANATTKNKSGKHRQISEDTKKISTIQGSSKKRK
ncbi:hypothetical protein ACJJTC_004068 [Scirpophaga incertulas]